MNTTESNQTFVGTPLYELKEGEEYLSQAQRTHLEQILRAWRTQLMEQVNTTVTHLQMDERVHVPDPIDAAQREEEVAIELRTRDRERKLIKKIDDTLEFVLDPNYGYCESCGAEIGLRRLEIRPTATQCIDCKTVNEIKEQRTQS
ncbi:MAG: RNA polymerase-binding protein DksA [Legionellales bacterium]|nr:RNA polymerase-binding protein DksA [Legionellales bacterium]|tara:strand:- start:66 stop:503 length:438 start_codon:yes stop_codon:yes gene_type:complete